MVLVSIFRPYALRFGAIQNLESCILGDLEDHLSGDYLPTGGLIFKLKMILQNGFYLQAQETVVSYRADTAASYLHMRRL
jgi:hypothetical protein